MVARIKNVKPGTPVKIRVPPPESSQTEERKAYWAGTFPACPVQNLSVAGTSFVRFQGTPNFDSKGVPDRNLEYGAPVELTDSQVDRIGTGLRCMVLRRLGKTRGVIMLSNARGYRYMDGDEPLAQHIYLVTGERQSKFPESMYDGVEEVEEVAEPEVAATG